MLIANRSFVVPMYRKRNLNAQLNCGSNRHFVETSIPPEAGSMRRSLLYVIASLGLHRKLITRCDDTY